MAKIGVGLVCHSAIQWLILRERDVHSYINEFIHDRAPSDTIDVAGPPTREMLESYRKGGDVEFPAVVLTLKKELRGDAPVIRVVVSDSDVATVQSWMLRAERGELFKTGDEQYRPAWQ